MSWVLSEIYLWLRVPSAHEMPVAPRSLRSLHGVQFELVVMEHATSRIIWFCPSTWSCGTVLIPDPSSTDGKRWSKLTWSHCDVTISPGSNFIGKRGKDEGILRFILLHKH